MGSSRGVGECPSCRASDCPSTNAHIWHRAKLNSVNKSLKSQRHAASLDVVDCEVKLVTLSRETCHFSVFSHAWSNALVTLTKQPVSTLHTLRHMRMRGFATCGGYEMKWAVTYVSL